MHTVPQQNNNAGPSNGLYLQDYTKVSQEDYFSAGSLQSYKRAKSVRDAFPPSPSGSHHISSISRRRSYLSRRDHRQKSESCFSPLDRPGHSMELSLDLSDSDSLPDLSDSNSTTGSTQSAITPTKPLVSSSFSFHFASPRTSKLSFDDLMNAEQSQNIVPKPSVFDIPELVYKIIEYADYQNTVIPKEKQPVRRKPLSLQHASLIHDGDVEQAKKAMDWPGWSTTEDSKPYNALHTCLLVNKLFNRVAKEIIGTKILFSKEDKFARFLNSDKSVFESTKPQVMVLNKLFHAKQASLDKIAESIDYSSLQNLEIFMCPRLKPPSSFLHSSLKSFVITGSKTLDDDVLISVSQRCPNLEVLDVRACEEVTDYGIYSVGSRCRKLRSINLGRKRKGNLITDHSVSKLVSNNPHLHTIGLAGCHITDRSIWQIAMSCGKYLERLSLNNCMNLTDQSLPVVLGHNLMPRLSVLEIRFIENLTNFELIVNFRRRQNAKGIIILIEACELLLRRLKACEKKMDNQISQIIFQDISEWANKEDDEDISYEDFIRARGQPQGAL